MVLTNSEDVEDDESFTRRFIYRASIKKEKSNESPVIQPKQKMNILYAINTYRFKGFEHKCTKLSDTALNFLNKELLVVSEMCGNDITTPSKLLEDETFLNEFKNDIVTKKCHNWDLKIDRTLNDDDLSRKSKIAAIPKEKSNVDSVMERSEISKIKCKDNKKDDKCLTRIKTDEESVKSKTPYTRLNEEIQDLIENLESLECKSYPMDTPKSKSFHFRIDSVTGDTIECSKKRLTDYMPDYMPGIHKAFEDISQRRENISNKLNETRPIKASQYKQAIPIPVNNDNVNKNIRKIEKPKRMKPNLESTMKSFSADSTKKNASPFSIPSSISTIMPNASSKSEFGEKNDDKYSYESLETTESIIPLKMRKFLDNALNSELLSSSYIFDSTSNNPNTSNSYEGNVHQTRNEWKVESKATPTRRQILNLRLLASEPSQSNINRKSKMLRSFSQELNKKESESSADANRRQTKDPIMKHKDKIQELLQRLEVEQTLIHQASKALNMCSFMKMFQHSIQHVESERLLLLSMLKKKAVLNEIKRINEFQDNNISLYEHGKVIISQIGLSVNKDKIDFSGLTPDMCGWFLVTVTHESTIWGTSAMNYSFDNPTTIRFAESITVPNLSPNFVIVLDVYSLQLRNISCDEKEEHSCNNRVTCPSPTNLWKRLERSRMKQNEMPCSSSIRDTSFQLTGYVQLTLQDLHKVPPWFLSSVPSNSILLGKIDFKLSREIKLSIIHSGFLTHGDEAGGLAAWSRRWCVLDGSCLKFWNYPQEHDLRPPLLIIDLTRCTTNEVQVVDRTICARPRTLMFKTMRERVSRDENSMFLECQCSYTVVRHLLSCDTTHDMMEWSSKLNYVLSILSNWKSRTDDFVPTTEL